MLIIWKSEKKIKNSAFLSSHAAVSCLHNVRMNEPQILNTGKQYSIAQSCHFIDPVILKLINTYVMIPFSQ